MENLKSVLVFLAFYVAASSAVGNVCRKMNHVGMLANSEPYYWPATWNEHQAAPPLEKEQNCIWNVAVPSGYYARLVMSGKTNDEHSRFQTIDVVGNIIITTQESKDPYFFPPQRFILEVSNEAAATFAFQIQWFKLPEITRRHPVNAIPYVINVTESIDAVEYSSMSISLITFPSNQKQHHSLRSVLIFDGNSMDTGYVSSLQSISQTHGQWLSSASVIVANVETSKYPNQLLIQDGTRTKDISEYVKMIPNNNGSSVINLNGGKQKSAIVSIANLNVTISDVDIADSANILIYHGTPDPFNLDKMFTGFTLKKALPLFIQGCQALEIVLKSGNGSFTFKY